MFLKPVILFKLLLLFSCMSQSGVSPNNYVIKGIVVDKHQSPVKRALIYVTKGTEETLSAEDGSFYFKAWGSPPFKVCIEYKDQPAIKFSVREITDGQLVLRM